MAEHTVRPESYIGVSGIVNQDQQQEIEDFLDHEELLKHRRRLMLGVKAVHKTQFLDVKNKYGPDWYPVGEASFVNVIKRSNNTLAVAQTFFDPEYIDNPGYREYFSDRIFRRGGSWIDGIQFDMLPWHSNAEMDGFLEKLKQKHEDKKVFLQCHKDAMEMLGPQGATRRLSGLAHVIDYVLFDASHGTGQRLDTERLRPYLEATYACTELDGIGIAVAGGLNGEVVRDDLATLAHTFPDLSWDAEGQLHIETKRGVRPLDMSKVRDYLQASTDILM